MNTVLLACILFLIYWPVVFMCGHLACALIKALVGRRP